MSIQKDKLIKLQKKLDGDLQRVSKEIYKAGESFCFEEMSRLKAKEWDIQCLKEDVDTLLDVLSDIECDMVKAQIISEEFTREGFGMVYKIYIDYKETEDKDIYIEGDVRELPIEFKSKRHMLKSFKKSPIFFLIKAVTKKG